MHLLTRNFLASPPPILIRLLSPPPNMHIRIPRLFGWFVPRTAFLPLPPPPAPPPSFVSYDSLQPECCVSKCRDG